MIRLCFFLCSLVPRLTRFFGKRIKQLYLSVSTSLQKIWLRTKDTAPIESIMWEASHFRMHPYRTFGIFSFLFTCRLQHMIIIYFSVHIFFAIIFAFIYSIHYSSYSAYLYFDESSYVYRLYFSIVTQISPGFTEFLPSNDLSRLITPIHGIIGIVINGLFLSLLFARAVHPYNVFDVVPFILHSPNRNQLIIRMYSKYPEPVHNLDFNFYRFYIFNNEHGEQLGRTEEIKILPEKRKMIRPYYGLLLRIELSYDALDWSDTLEDDQKIRTSMPYNWFVNDNRYNGHYYLIISADTTSGTAYYVQDFFLNRKNIRCGEHMLLNHQKNLDIFSWYNYRRYSWETWGKRIEPDCSLCKFPKCIYKKDEGDVIS